MKSNNENPLQLQKAYCDYVLSTLFDCLSHLRRVDVEFEDYNEYSQIVQSSKRDALHAVKDSMYEPLLVSGSDHILDMIFEALKQESAQSLNEFYFVVQETLSNVYMQLADKHSKRRSLLDTHLHKNWNSLKGIVSMRARWFLHCELTRLKEESV